MSNPFKVGDKITINAASLLKYSQEARDCSADTAYELIHVGTWWDGTTKEPTAICFKDDVGDYVTIGFDDVTLVEG